MSLVNTDWLQNNINKVKIIDCSWHMPQTKKKWFRRIQKTTYSNSIFFDLDENSKKIPIYHICLLKKMTGKKLFQIWE